MNAVSKEKLSFDDITAKLPQAYKDEITDSGYIFTTKRINRWFCLKTKNPQKLRSAGFFLGCGGQI